MLFVFYEGFNTKAVHIREAYSVPMGKVVKFQPSVHCMRRAYEGQRGRSGFLMSETSNAPLVWHD